MADNTPSAGSHSNFVDGLLEQARIANMWAHRHPEQAIQVANNLLQGGAYQTQVPSDVAANIEASQRHAQANAEAQIRSLQHQQLMQQQQQQILGQQGVFNMQTNMQAFSNMLPGAVNPAFSLGMNNAQALNQQMLMMAQNNMNPYIAAAMSQSAMGQNLVDAQYMTSPRMGVFRQAPQGLGPEAIGGSRGLFWDLATTMGARSFAMYEDPFLAVQQARGRMFRRGESLVSTGVSAGSIGAGLMMGGPLGVVAGLGLEAVTSTITDQYFGRRAQAQRIHEMTRPLITTGDVGPAGAGLSYRASSELVSDMRRYAAESPFFNQRDMESMLRSSAEAGTMNFVGRREEIMRALKNQAEMLHVFMRITGDPDLQSAFQRMARFQTLGISTGNQVSFLNNVQAFARTAGIGVQQMMDTGVALGAQQAVQVGAAPQLGAELGAMSRAFTRVAQQRGVFNPLQMAIRGGQEGVAQNVTAMALGGINRQLGLGLAGLVTRDENGEFTIDEDAVQDYITGGTSTSALIRRSQSNLRRWGPGGTRAFMRERRDLSALLQSNLTPGDVIGLIRAQVRGAVDASGGRYTTDDAYRLIYGENWKEMREFAGAENARAQAQTMSHQYSRMRFAEMERIRSANAWYNRLGTAFASSVNNIYEGLFGDILRQQAEKQQLAEAAASGTTALPGLNSLLSKESRDFAKKAGRSLTTDLSAEELARGNVALQEYMERHDLDEDNYTGAIVQARYLNDTIRRALDKRNRKSVRDLNVGVRNQQIFDENRERIVAIGAQLIEEHKGMVTGEDLWEAVDKATLRAVRQKRMIRQEDGTYRTVYTNKGFLDDIENQEEYRRVVGADIIRHIRRYGDQRTRDNLLLSGEETNIALEGETIGNRVARLKAAREKQRVGMRGLGVDSIVGNIFGYTAGSVQEQAADLYDIYALFEGDTERMAKFLYDTPESGQRKILAEAVGTGEGSDERFQKLWQGLSRYKESVTSKTAKAHTWKLTELQNQYQGSFRGKTKADLLKSLEQTFSGIESEEKLRDTKGDAVIGLGTFLEGGQSRELKRASDSLQKIIRVSQEIEERDKIKDADVDAAFKKGDAELTGHTRKTAYQADLKLIELAEALLPMVRST
jgi:hypothetical protein